MKEDLVNHPKHYNSHPTGIECIELAQHYGFSTGNVLKYMWRAGIKKELGKDDIAKELEDIDKAIWYINHFIKELEAQDHVVFDKMHDDLFGEGGLIDARIHPFNADPDVVAKHYTESVAEAFRCMWWLGLTEFKYVLPYKVQIELANKAILNLQHRKSELKSLYENEK